MKRSEETFRATPELGTRLRGLRVAAGVTQQELALAMEVGRKIGGPQHIVALALQLTERLELRLDNVARVQAPDSLRTQGGNDALVSSLVEYYNRPNEWVESAEFGLRPDY